MAKFTKKSCGGYPVSSLERIQPQLTPPPVTPTKPPVAQNAPVSPNRVVVVAGQRYEVRIVNGKRLMEPIGCLVPPIRSPRKRGVASIEVKPAVEDSVPVGGRSSEEVDVQSSVNESLPVSVNESLPSVSVSESLPPANVNDSLPPVSVSESLPPANVNDSLPVSVSGKDSETQPPQNAKKEARTVPSREKPVTTEKKRVPDKLPQLPVDPETRTHE